MMESKGMILGHKIIPLKFRIYICLWIPIKVLKHVSLWKLFQFQVFAVFSSRLGGSLHSHHRYCNSWPTFAKGSSYSRVMQYHTTMFNLIPYNIWYNCNTIPGLFWPGGLGVPSLSPCHSNFAKLSCCSMASFLLVVFRINSTTTNETTRLKYWIFTATISAKHCRNQQNRNLLIRKKLFRIYFIKLLQLCFFSSQKMRANAMQFFVCIKWEIVKQLPCLSPSSIKFLHEKFHFSFHGK